MIAIVDYGVGNLFSLSCSLEYLGFPAKITAEAAELRAAERIILPGVGAFGDAVARLRATGLAPVLEAEVASGKPLLGICLGMQLLFEESQEYGRHAGLGWIPGGVYLGCEMKPWRRVLGVLITFHVVCFGWILFRATSMKAVGEMLRQIFTNFHPEVFMQFVLGYKGVFALMVIGYVLHFMPKRSEDALRGVVTRSPLLIQAAILAIAIFIVVQFKSAGVQPFIYFQF